jgi:hypothetical protein
MALVCPPCDFRTNLAEALKQRSTIFLKELECASSSHLTEMEEVGASDLDVIFLSADETKAFQDASERLRRRFPNVQIVAIAARCTPELLLVVMRSGIRELLALPLSSVCLDGCLRRVAEVGQPQSSSKTLAKYA